MTSERAPSRAAIVSMSPHEWRLWLTAVLAGGYAVVAVALGAGAPPSPPPMPATMPAAASARGEVAWLDALPPAERPRVVLPPGWAIDVAGATVTEPAVARVAASEPRARTWRVRTRSS